MMMIISHHIVVHCVKEQFYISTVSYGFGVIEPTVVDMLSKKHFILSFFSLLGQTANGIFLLISGYFIAGKESGSMKCGHLIKVSKKLLSQMAFAAVVIFFFSSLVFIVKPELNAATLDLGIFNSSWAWFVGYYFTIVLIADLFLNRFLSNSNKEKYLAFLLVVFSLSQFGWAGKIIDSLAPGLRTVLIGLFLFSLGGFIRIHAPFSRLRLSSVIILIILILGFIFFGSRNYVYTQYQNIAKTDLVQPFPLGVPGYSNFNIFAVLLSVSLFEIFRRLHLPNSKVINRLGASTFMVYLIHDNSFFYSLWHTQDWAGILIVNPISFLFKLFLWVLATFFIGATFYFIFLCAGRLFKKLSWLFISK